MVAPILAAKGLQNASKPLTGDIYVRRWTTVKGKGKKKKELDHELHVNPVSVGVAALVAAGAAATVAVGLWLTQQKVGKTDQAKTKTRFARLYEAVYETVTVVDTPARDETVTTYIHGYPKTVVVHYEAVTHQETRVARASRLVVYTDRMLPIRTVAEATNYDGVISKHEAAQGWVTVGEFGTVFTTGEDRLGKYVEVKVSLKNDSKFKYGISPRAGLLE
jgi:hypothetical protein